jgi:hypothetical protein
MRHWEKSRSLVCGLVIAVDMMAMQFWISASWVFKYFSGEGWRANEGSKEAEAGGEFGMEGWTKGIYVI